MHEVVETADYLADARGAGVSDAEREDIVSVISADPLAGDLMVGTGGARKVRIAGRGKGKSGGYRVITYFGGGDIPVFLLALLSKGQRSNITKAEANELRAELATLADDYRASVAAKVDVMRRQR